MSTNTTSVNGTVISADGVSNNSFGAEYTTHNMPLHLKGLEAEDVDIASRLKRLEAEEAVIASITASAQEAKNNAATISYKTREKQKNLKKKRPQIKNRKGRKGDTRMHRAVAARLADSRISLLDALRKGGFDYSPLPEYGLQRVMHDVEDSEGVQLGQRKNQLNRRLRLLRKEAANGGGINGNAGAGVLKMKANEGENVFRHGSDDDSERLVSAVELTATEVDPGDMEDGIGVAQATTAGSLSGLATITRTPLIPSQENKDEQIFINAHEIASVSSSTKTFKPITIEVPKESFQQPLKNDVLSGKMPFL